MKNKIKSIHRNTQEVDVYDIEVEDAHHYILENGLVSHNSGPAYANSCTLELTKAQLKRGDDVVGGIFTSKATKNRLAREKTKVKFKISFEHGMARYSGLDIAAESTNWLILPERARSYRVNIGGVIPPECKGKTKDAKVALKTWLETLPQVSKNIIEDGTDGEFWDDFLDKGFENVLKDMFKYGDGDFLLDLSGDVQEDLD